MKKVYKYGTGEPIPEGAVYLRTVVQKEILLDSGCWRKTWLIWHYFLVEVEDSN